FSILPQAAAPDHVLFNAAAEFDREHSAVALLDLSSNADQLGVAISLRQSFDLRIDKLALNAAGMNLAVFTVPEISWEPMLSDPPVAGLDSPANDGGPSIIEVETIALTPIAPEPVLRLFLDHINNRNDETLSARFTLPFGLRAQVQQRE